MKRAFLSCLLVAAGCGHANLADVVGGAEKGMKAIDAGIDVAGDVWITAVDARAAYCTAKGHETEAAKEACMGPFATDLTPKVERASELYDTIVKAFAELEQLAKELDPLLEQARKERQP